MLRALTSPLVPFVDDLPVPQRLIAREHDGQLTVPIRSGAHRFHRDLPESPIWGYFGTLPGPTIEAERGQAVTVEWLNQLDGQLPMLVTRARRRTSSRLARMASSTTRWTSAARCSGTTTMSWASPDSVYTRGWRGFGSCVMSASVSSGYPRALHWRYRC